MMHSSDNNLNSLNSGQDSLGLSDIINIILNQKNYVLAFTAIVFLFFVAYVTISDNVYRSEIKFIKSENLSTPESSNLPSIGGLASFSGLGLDSNSREEEIAVSVLFSKKFLYEFLKKHDKIFLELQSDESNSGLDWRQNGLVMEDLYIEFKDLINHDKNKQTKIHTLSVSWSNAEDGAFLANALLDDLNVYTRELAQQKAEKRIEFLSREQASSDLINSKAIFSKLIESSINENMIANTEVEYSFEIIDPAVPSSYHYSPNRLYLLFIGLFLGTFIGILSAFIKEFLVKDT